MDISPFIQTAFGAIAGGGVVVATNWLTARAEKKRQIQEWWEQQYATEGIDRLAAYLKSIQIYSANMNLVVGTNPPMIAGPQEIPLEALANRITGHFSRRHGFHHRLLIFRLIQVKSRRT